MTGTITLHIGYYAAFREQRGLSRETVETRAATPAELFRDLRERYGFTLPETSVRVAINREFKPMDATLSSGDEVAFIPPVAGG